MRCTLHLDRVDKAFEHLCSSKTQRAAGVEQRNRRRGYVRCDIEPERRLTLPGDVTLRLLGFEFRITGDLDNKKFYLFVSFNLRRIEGAKQVIDAACPEILEIAAIHDAVGHPYTGGYQRSCRVDIRKPGRVVGRRADGYVRNRAHPCEVIDRICKPVGLYQKVT